MVPRVELFVRNIGTHMDSSGQKWTKSDRSGINRPPQTLVNVADFNVLEWSSRTRHGHVNDYQLS